MPDSNSTRQIFISYTGLGELLALRLKAYLEREFPKVNVWEWQGEIGFGSTITSNYREALEVSHIFIPVITENYKERKGTRDELRRAKKRETKLKNYYGKKYEFIIPYVDEHHIELLKGIKLSNRRAVKNIDEVAKAVSDNLDKISLKDNPYSFENWPDPFIDAQGEVDSIIVIGHSGKEDKPKQEELGEIGKYIQVEGSETLRQSMRPAEFIPELIYFFNKESFKRQIDAKKTIHELEPQLLDVHVDWHLLKHYQNLIASNNLICLGAGDTNLISRWAMTYYEQYLPVHFDGASSSHSIMVDPKGGFRTVSLYQLSQGHSTDERFGAILLLLPNPLNKDKVILIAAGLTGLGTQAAMLALSDLSQRIRHPTNYSNYARVIKGIEDRWRAIGYEIIAENLPDDE